MSEPAPSLSRSLSRLPIIGPVWRVVVEIRYLPRLRAETQALRAEVDGLRPLCATVEQLRSELGAVRTDQATTAAEAARQRAELAGVRDELAVLRAELSALGAELSTARADLGAVRAELQAQAGLLAQLGAMRADHDNLVQSVPVALRRLTREVQALRSEPDRAPSGAG